MKSVFFGCLLAILACLSTKTYSQEEFYGNHNGISIGYFHALKLDYMGMGFSGYFKKGIIAGLNLERQKNIPFAQVGVLFCPHWKNQNFLKFAFGPFFAYRPNYLDIQLNMALYQCFNEGKSYPLSLRFSLSPELLVYKKYSYTLYSSYSKIKKKIDPVIGFAYTQAFGAKNLVYPFVSIADSYAFNPKINMFSVMAGLNFKLD